MPLPLPRTIKASKVLPKQIEYLQNSFHGDGMLLSRPGAELVAAHGEQVPRGTFVWQNQLYAVIGSELCLFDGSSLSLAAILPGSNPIRYARGFSMMAICAPESQNYTISMGGALSPVTDSDLPVCRDVERVDGYFLWVPDNGDPVVFSAVNDAGDIDPLDYFDAEASPDVNLGVINFRNDLFVFGAETIERFRNVGAETAPFVRVAGGMIQAGYVGGKLRSTDTFVWLGKDQDAGYGFFAYVNGTANRISTPAVDEILEHDYTPTELSRVDAQRLSWRGFDLYVWTLPRHTLCFVGGSWSYFTSGVDTLGVTPWQYRFASQFDGNYYAIGDNGLVKLTAAHQDEGQPIDRRLVTFARSRVDQVFTPDFLRLAASHGLSGGTKTVGLRLSRDGKLWSDRFYRELGAIGEYEQQLEWRYPGGLGQFDGFMAMEISTGSDCEFAADGAVIGL